MTTQRRSATAVCITGMHRSGTSLVARVLKECGVYLGPEEALLPARPENRDGFWEHAALTKLNDELLAALGGSWDDPPELRDGWELAPELNQFAERARGLLAPLRSHPPWGWKDPRSSLTLRFWQRAAGEQLDVVVCLRHPAEVVASLVARGGLSREQAARVSLVYLEALGRADDRIVVDYESFLAEPDPQLERLTRALDLDPEPLQLARALESVNRSLKHQQPTGDVPPELLAAYERLRAEAATESARLTQPDQATQLEATRGLLRETRQQAYAAQDELAAALAAAQREFDRLDDEARREAARHQQEVEAMQAELARAKEHADGLEEQLRTIQATRIWRFATFWWSFRARIGSGRRTVG